MLAINRMVMFSVAAVAALIATAAPAAAQSYNAEIDCGGIFAPGDVVPFTLRFEEQAFQVHTINFTVELDRPGFPPKVIISKVFTLNPNQDLTVARSLTLKAGAPLGSYDMALTADDGTLIAMDTCSFDVQ
jgi:hypothetical protein